MMVPGSLHIRVSVIARQHWACVVVARVGPRCNKADERHARSRVSVARAHTHAERPRVRFASSTRLLPLVDG